MAVKLFILSILLFSKKQQTTAILGGKNARQDRYPWYVRGFNDPNAAVPGVQGVLIAQDFVLFPYFQRSFHYWTDSSCCGNEVAAAVEVSIYCRVPGNCGQDLIAYRQDGYGNFAPPASDTGGRLAASDNFVPSRISGPRFKQLVLVKLPEMVNASKLAVPDDGTASTLLKNTTDLRLVGLGRASPIPDTYPVTLQEAQVSYHTPCTDEGNEGGTPFCTAGGVGVGMCSWDYGSSVIMTDRGRNGEDVVVAMSVLGGESCGSGDLDYHAALKDQFEWMRFIVCRNSAEPPYWCFSEVVPPENICNDRPQNQVRITSKTTCKKLKKENKKVIKKACKSKDSNAATACPKLCNKC